MSEALATLTTLLTTHTIVVLEHTDIFSFVVDPRQPPLETAASLYQSLNRGSLKAHSSVSTNPLSTLQPSSPDVVPSTSPTVTVDEYTMTSSLSSDSDTLFTFQDNPCAAGNSTRRQPLKDHADQRSAAWASGTGPSYFHSAPGLTGAAYCRYGATAVTPCCRRRAHSTGSICFAGAETVAVGDTALQRKPWLATAATAVLDESPSFESVVAISGGSLESLTTCRKGCHLRRSTRRRRLDNHNSHSRSRSQNRSQSDVVVIILPDAKRNETVTPRQCGELLLLDAAEDKAIAVGKADDLSRFEPVTARAASLEECTNGATVNRSCCDRGTASASTTANHRFGKPLPALELTTTSEGLRSTHTAALDCNSDIGSPVYSPPATTIESVSGFSWSSSISFSSSSSFSSTPSAANEKMRRKQITCKVSNCERAVVSRHYCGIHLEQHCPSSRRGSILPKEEASIVDTTTIANSTTEPPSSVWDLLRPNLTESQVQQFITDQPDQADEGRRILDLAKYCDLQRDHMSSLTHVNRTMLQLYSVDSITTAHELISETAMQILHAREFTLHKADELNNAIVDENIGMQNQPNCIPETIRSLWKRKGAIDFDESHGVFAMLLGETEIMEVRLHKDNIIKTETSANVGHDTDILSPSHEMMQSLRALSSVSRLVCSRIQSLLDMREAQRRTGGLLELRREAAVARSSHGTPEHALQRFLVVTKHILRAEYMLTLLVDPVQKTLVVLASTETLRSLAVPTEEVRHVHHHVYRD